MWPAVYLTILVIAGAAVDVSGNKCITNCSTISQHTIDDTQHLISCSMQPTKCKAFSNTSVPPSPPKKVSKDALGWYLYPSGDGVDKIALNITWDRAHEGSVESLQGYYFGILSNGKVLKEVYYCLHTIMQFNLHIFAQFYYDCYGTAQNETIQPGQQFVAFIASLPHAGPSLESNALKWTIDIPGCSDKRMANVQQCIDRRSTRLAVKNYDCPKRTAEISYSVPKAYGDTAHIILCYAEQYRKIFTLCEKEKTFNDLPLSSNNFSLILPDDFDIEANISVLLEGDNNQGPQFISYIKFQCEEPTPPPISIIIPVCIIVAVAIGAAIFIFANRKRVKKFVESCGPEMAPGDPAEHTSKQDHIEETIIKYETVGETRTICLTFVEDHQMHTDVLHAFATFLQNDLGFKVVFELWEQEDIYKDASTWIDNAVANSDKVIVVWSPRAFERWTNFTKGKMEQDQQDLFTPILKQIQKDLVFTKNRGKYFFTFFDYCSESDIPEKFRDITFCHFRLMRQFKELYFHLVDQEMFKPGAYVSQDKVEAQHYFNQSLNKYGHTLKTRIDRMCKLVKENPLWYKSNLPASADVEIGPTIDEEQTSDELLMVNMLDIAPPPPLFTPIQSGEKEATVSDRKVDEVPVAVDPQPKSCRQPVENVESYMASDDEESIEPEAQIKELLPKKSKHFGENLRLNIARRLPCENSDTARTEQLECPVLAPLNNAKNNGTSPEDSGIATLSPQPDSLLSGYSIHASSFHFDDDEDGLDDSVRVGESAHSPQLAPIDLTNDPWKSLASFNMQSETDCV